MNQCLIFHVVFENERHLQFFGLDSEFLPLSRDGAAQPAPPDHSDTTTTSKRRVQVREQLTSKNAAPKVSFYTLRPSHLVSSTLSFRRLYYGWLGVQLHLSV